MFYIALAVALAVFLLATSFGVFAIRTLNPKIDKPFSVKPS